MKITKIYIVNANMHIETCKKIFMKYIFKIKLKEQRKSIKNNNKHNYSLTNSRPHSTSRSPNNRVPSLKS